MTQHFTIATDAEGVATITWDTPGKSMNVMSIEGFHQLDGLIDNALADDAIKGIVITSGKPGSFAGGMDLNVIAKMRDDGGDDPSIPTFTTTDDGVTVGLPSDGGDGVAPVLGTNVAGDPTMECPEGYELVDGPNGPTCVKIEESYRLRAGASTRPTSRARDRRMRAAFPQVRARLSHMPALTTRTFYPQVCDSKAQRLKHGANSGPRSPPGSCRAGPG